MKELNETERQWIEDYCNEVISPEQFEAFQDALEESEELRAELRRYLSLDAGLRQGSESVQDIQVAWREEKEPVKIARFPAAWQWGIAALLLIGVILVFRQPSTPTEEEAIAEKTELSAQGFGVLTGSDGAVWASHPNLEHGDLVPAGEVELKEGVAQLELFSGVTLVVEGKASFEIHSAMEMTVAQGKVRANVPEPAQGFRIKAAGGEIVDLGTEFAVRVTSEESQVHVIDGEVEWYPANRSEKQLMKKGEGLSWRKEEGERPLEARAEDFVGMQELTERLDNGRSSRRNAWLAYSRELARDERLIAYFPMSQPGRWHRTLYNEARAEGAVSDGAIVAARRSEDRFGDVAGALDFSGTGSRVRLKVEQELTALTLLTWVKIDSLDRWYNSLFLTDGHELNEPHWQIMDDGRLFFSVKRRTHDKVKKLWDKHIVYSKPFWTPAMSGKWTQIVTTYDTANYAVCHFINGEKIHEEVLPENMRVDRIKIGPATIGNWSEPTRNDPKFSVRNFNGSMDEFAVFSVALDEGEISELYRKGKP